MAEDRYAKHAKSTAMCVDFALDSVEDDIQRELDSATGHVAAALTRVLNRVKGRRKAIGDLIAPNIANADQKH
jgi:hypothetical protein